MIGSTALVNKALLILLALTLLYFVGMDILLYIRVQNYDVRPTTTNNSKIYQSVIPCDLNPLCIVTVKSLMLDHLNHYAFSPLAALVDGILGISSSWTWITPNAISFFHVLVAVAAGRFVSSDSLSHRRLGVVLFQARTWLDDLDGHVSRKRANVFGERSNVGSTGYLVDGFCDGLGCIALVFGLFQFLARNPPKRGYDKLQQLPLSSSNIDSVYVTTLKASSWNKALRNALLLIGQLFVISAAWNRYISVYQDLLETDVVGVSSGAAAAQLYARQTNVFRSGMFWKITVCWRFVNYHAVVDYLLLAIFVDRVWEYLRIVRWSSYVIAFLLAYVTELHYTHVYTYVRGLPNVTEQKESALTEGMVAS